MKTVLELIKEHAIFHDFTKYNPDRNSFDMNICRITEPGVYFFLDGDDILKVGKGDGRIGLKGRIGNYRQKNFAASNGDAQAKMINRVFSTKKMQKKKLSVYVLPVPMIDSPLYGRVVQMSRARSLELQLSKQAEEEGHSLLMSSHH